MIPIHLSIGAAIGPLLAGALAGGNHWGMIFNMLVISDVFSLLFLSRFGKCKNVRFWCKTRCSDNDDSGVQADHERVGEFISFLEKYKAISKLQLNQFLISRLHPANLIWWRFWSNKKNYHQNDAAIISTRLWSIDCCPEKETPKSLLHVYKTNQSPAALSLWLFKHKSFHDLQYIGNVNISDIENVNISELFCPRVWHDWTAHICICIMYMINIVFSELKNDLSKLKSRP